MRTLLHAEAKNVAIPLTPADKKELRQFRKEICKLWRQKQCGKALSLILRLLGKCFSAPAVVEEQPSPLMTPTPILDPTPTSVSPSLPFLAFHPQYA